MPVTLWNAVNKVEEDALMVIIAHTAKMLMVVKDEILWYFLTKE